MYNIHIHTKYIQSVTQEIVIKYYTRFTNKKPQAVRG